MRKRKLLLLLAVVLTLAACQKQVVHPNQVSALDGQAYDVLVTAHAAIEGAKADVASGALPASVKPVLNKAVQSYNVARGAWLTYRHTVELAVPGNVAPAAQAAALQSAMNDLTGAISTLTKGATK